jgi:hypothetical protein
MKHIFYSVLAFSLILAQDDRSTLFYTGPPPDLNEGWDIRCSEYASSTIGDVNQDGSIDVLDVVTIVGFILGNTVPTDDEASYSDANQDSNIDVLDVIIIVNLILNGSESECVEGLSAAVKFTSPSNEYTFEAFAIYIKTTELEGNGLFEVNLHSDDFNSPGAVLGSWELVLNENYAGFYEVFTGGTDCILFESETSYWLSVHPIDNQDDALWLFSENEFPYSTSNDLGDSWSFAATGQVGSTAILGEQIYDSPGTEPSLEPVYDWALEDINPNSEYYAQNIGPSTFIDNDFVSVYYFGKAG